MGFPRCLREQRRIPAQERGRSAVVTRGCLGQLVAVAYWGVSLGGKRERRDVGTSRFLVPPRVFRGGWVVRFLLVGGRGSF